MFNAKKYIAALVLILVSIHLPAQNLTGTWEGDLGNDQFLQLNIIQTGNQICGYTRDYVKLDQRSYCKAFFEGNFDAKNKTLRISGSWFIERTEDHVLMNLMLRYNIEKGVAVLRKEPVVFSPLSRLRDIFGTEKNERKDPFERDDPFKVIDSTGYVFLKKVSDQPNEIHELMKDCIARDKKKADPDKKIIQSPDKKDSIHIAAKPAIIPKDSIVIPEELTQRKNIEQSLIEVSVKTINLKVYDNAIMDGDTVSIYYNGKMLLNHQPLSEKAIEINLELEEGQTRHEIVLFAENLGSIPPNTALVVITAGDKRYELFASANLQENAVLVFNYKPK